MPASFQVVPQTRTARVPRRPQHTFNHNLRPWQLVPIMCAPVLPGETLKNMLFQARAVSKPLKDPLVGWWLEMFFWYVKHRDFNPPERDNMIRMMIDPSYSLTGSAAAATTYNFSGGYDFCGQCMTRCTETYFRDTGEAASIAAVGGYNLAQISQQSALDSALLDSAYTSGAPGLVVGADDTITGSELSATQFLWQQYRASNINHMSYEEYLATYGIPLPQGSDSERRPELIRYTKSWTYPVNTVDPATGTPSSAVSWAISERADKDRFFREPGLIFAMALVRPKVYLSGQSGAVVSGMMNALNWLPAVMGDNPEYSMKLFSGSAGPFGAVTSPYRIDLKDLFLYGDQMSNMATSLPNQVALPSATLGKKYPASTDMDALFKTGTANTISIDGVVSLNILGNQVETTPTRAPGTF